jgi:3',5'-cyclic-AMP phosphodiesterase
MFRRFSQPKVEVLRMKFIHLTDTHLVPPGKLLYGLDPQQRLRAAVQSINREHGDAALVMVTGDLAHWGEPAAYYALKDELARLCMPVHMLIGNHDDRKAFRTAFADRLTDSDGYVQFALSEQGVRFVCLDTNEPGVSWGVFCEKRATWLAEELRMHDEPVCLFMHHPPFPVGIASMDSIALRDASWLRRAIEPHRRRVRHLFFGHLHRPLAGSWLGIPVSTVRGTNHQVALDLGTAPKVPGSHEPPQYAVVLTSPEQTVVHMHDFLDTSTRFDL